MAHNERFYYFGAIMVFSLWLIVFPPPVTQMMQQMTQNSFAASSPVSSATGYRFVEGSTYVVHVPSHEGMCQRPNSPRINHSFYTSMRSFVNLRLHAAATVEAVVRGGLNEALRMLWVLRNDTVRPNPGSAPTSPELGPQALKLIRCSEMHLRLSMCKGYDFVRSAGNMLKFLETKTRASWLASTAASLSGAPVPTPPAHFVDFGGRVYSAKQPFESSVRWFELHYPRFDALTVDVFEVDAEYADSYASFARHRERLRRPRLRFFPAAVWVHDDGLSMPSNDMMSAELKGHCSAGGPRGRDGCQCAATVDIAQYLRPFPPGSVVVKMDVEGAEWQLVERLIVTSTLDRVFELFLECHSLDWTPDSFFAGDLAKAALDPESREEIFRSSDGGFDCNALVDLLRSKGVHTSLWP